MWNLPGAGAERAARLLEDILLTGRADAGAAGKNPAAALDDESHAPSAALLSRVLTSLDDDKAEEVVQVDLRGKTEIADYMVIASGRSSRQVSAIAEKLLDRLKTDPGIRARAEGKEAGDWVLIDAGDVIVHIFRPEVRDFYQLEKMWAAPALGDARAAGSA